MIVAGIDPGYEKSAIVVFNGLTVLDRGIMSNNEMLEHLTHLREEDAADDDQRVVVIEQIESFGMAVGKEVFETVWWAGRFAQAWHPKRWDRLVRRIIKTHLCHSARATDANIRTALIDRFGGTEKAIGRKKEPGPLYDIKSHCWPALAVAITWFDLNGHQAPDVRPGVKADF